MSAYADAIARQERAKAHAAQAHDPIICPKCGGSLDTGYECLDCGYDAAPVTQPATSQEGEARKWKQAIGAEIDRQCGIGAGTCGTADDGSGLFEVNASLDLNGFARAMALAATPTPPTLSEDLLG